MSTKDHWDAVYRSTAPDSVSWYQPHLVISLDLIERAASDLSSAILDVGGGESTLVDDLIAYGYQNVAVLDVSERALDVTKERLGTAAERVSWITGDVTAMSLQRQSVDVWHDRAVFHFLTGAEERAAYLSNLLHSLRPDGHVIIGAFGSEGPDQCSGLPVVRYDSRALHDQLGSSFRVVETREEKHLTPWNTTQQFVFCHFRVTPAGSLQNA